MGITVKDACGLKHGEHAYRVDFFKDEKHAEKEYTLVLTEAEIRELEADKDKAARMALAKGVR